MRLLIGLILFISALKAQAYKAVLDGHHIQTRQQLHQSLQTQLHLPAYYGANLDALYDALINDLNEASIVSIRNETELHKNLGWYWEHTWQTLQDAQKEGAPISLLKEPLL